MRFTAGTAGEWNNELDIIAKIVYYINRISGVIIMKISTRGRYGLRAMLELAQNFEDGPVLMKKIAEKQEISMKYLHTLLTMLKAAGLVHSVRGAGGGYSLTRPPSEIKVSEVVRVLEGSLSPVECVKDRSLCKRAELCVARDVWSDLGEAIETLLSGLTLDDLLVRMKEKEAVPRMYFI
jgi:Rrf2 family cysteine metabolism transcriptional repressor